MKLRNLGRILNLFGDRPTPCIDLDDPRVKKVTLEQSSVEQPTDEPDDENPFWVAFMCVLSQCMLDEALCLHMFIDEPDGCIRLQEYMRVHPEWQSPDWAISRPISSDTSEHLEAGNHEIESAAGPSVSDERRTRWTWVEMYPMPIELHPFLFDEIRGLLNIPRRETTGDFQVRYRGKDIDSHFDQLSDVDVRLYFGDARPVIRPKTAAQVEEVRARQDK